MSFQRIKLYHVALLGLATGAMIWWVVSAGPVTVQRTIVYNFSGIDDNQIFPQRTLEAAPLAFQFHEGMQADGAPLRKRFKSHVATILSMRRMLAM